MAVNWSRCVNTEVLSQDHTTNETYQGLSVMSVHPSKDLDVIWSPKLPRLILQLVNIRQLVE